MESETKRNINSKIIIEAINKTIKNCHSGILLEKYLPMIEKPVFILTIGKASWEMGLKCSKLYKDNIISGLIVTKKGFSKKEIDKFEIIESGHPYPDKNSILAVEKAISMIQQLPKDTKIIILISGGGSSLFERPIDGININLLNEIYKYLINSGYTITEINNIRKLLSTVKNGKFIQYLKNYKTDVFVLSDVLTNDLSTIASGICYYKEITYNEVIINKIKNKFQINLQIDSHPIKKHIPHHLIGDNLMLSKICLTYLKRCGLEGTISPKIFDFNIYIGLSIIEKELSTMKDDFIIYRGEITLKVNGNGKGGRCTEFALRVAEILDKKQKGSFIAFASDGNDGNTNSSGAFVSYKTMSQIKTLNLDYQKFLNNNDSFTLLKKIDSILPITDTGTNLNDLYILFKDDWDN